MFPEDDEKAFGHFRQRPRKSGGLAEGIERFRVAQRQEAQRQDAQKREARRQDFQRREIQQREIRKTASSRGAGLSSGSATMPQGKGQVPRKTPSDSRRPTAPHTPERSPPAQSKIRKPAVKTLVPVEGEDVRSILTGMMRPGLHQQSGALGKQISDALRQGFTLAYPGEKEPGFQAPPPPAIGPDHLKSEMARLAAAGPGLEEDLPNSLDPKKPSKEQAAEQVTDLQERQAAKTNATSTNAASPGDPARDLPKAGTPKHLDPKDRKKAQHRRRAEDRLWENGNPDVRPGETIQDNHHNYARMDEALNRVPGAIRTNWFKAASEVTGLTGIGAADFPNGYFLSDQDEDYMRYVHHKLAVLNTENYKKLLNGELPDGVTIPPDARDPVKALDYALVEWEQKQVTRLTDAWFRENPDLNRKEILNSISRAIDPAHNFPQDISSAGSALRDWAASAFSLDRIVDDTFQPGTYDMDNEADRIKLGQAIVNYVAREK